MTHSYQWHILPPHRRGNVNCFWRDKEVDTEVLILTAYMFSRRFRYPRVRVCTWRKLCGPRVGCCSHGRDGLIRKQPKYLMEVDSCGQEATATNRPIAPGKMRVLCPPGTRCISGGFFYFLLPFSPYPYTAHSHSVRHSIIFASVIG